MADEVWLDVLPSMNGFAQALTRGANQAAQSAGQQSGRQYSNAFAGGAQGAADGVVKELESAQKQSAGLVQKLAGQVSTARQTQQKSAADLLTAEQRLADATSKYGEESNQAQAAALRLEAARSKAEDATRRFESAENALKEEQRTHRAVTEQLTAAQADLSDEVREAPGLWGKLGDALSGARGKAKSFGDTAGGMATKVAGAVGGVALLTGAFFGAVESESVVDRLNASLAATPVQAEIYGAATGNLYANAFGENMQDVTTSVDAVVSSMAGMRDASAADIEQITGYAMNLAKTFEVDVAEATSTAGIMMKTGLASDATTAMDLIAGAMNQVPAQMRGEILPVMSEYSKHFATLGIDGETAMGLIVAASQDGAIGMDKVGDSLKEISIRTATLDTNAVKAYESIGLSASDMASAMAQGGEVGSAAFAKTIAGLQSIKDPAAQAQAAIALFGTPLEDLGTDQIPAFLAQMSAGTGTLDGFAGSSAALGDTLNNNTGTSLAMVQRSFEGMLTNGITPLLGPLNGFLQWAANTPGVMTAVAVALGIVAVAWAAVTLAASPWLALGVGIALVIGGIILAVQNWGSIVDWLAGAWGGFISWIGGVMTAYRDTWVAVWSTITGWVTDKWNGMIAGIVGLWTNKLKPTLDAVGLGARLLYETYVQPALDNIGGAWDRTMSGLKSVWENILKPVFDTIASIVKGDLPGAFEHGTKAIRGIWDGIKGIAAKPINFVIDTVYNNGLRKAFNFVAKALPGVSQLEELDTIPAYAKGGLHKGGWALVGEQGPELVNFSNPGRVYTAAQTAEALADGGQLSPEQMAAAAGRNPSEAVLPMGGWWEDIKAGAAQAWGAATQWVRGGLASAAGLVLNPIKDGLAGLIPGGGLPAMGRGASAKAIDSTLSWLRGEDAKAAAEGMAVYNGPLGAFHRPSKGPITSGYGPRWGSFHTGIDIAGGGPTYAALPGVVQRVGWNSVPGKTGIGIYLNHGPGLWTYYGHNPVGGPQVKVGQQVKAGQHIGYQGATGNVTGVHTHFEVHRGRVNGTVNPAAYLYDDGGVLQPGVTTVVNKTRQPEAILTNPQWQAVQRLAVEGEGGDTYITVTVDAKDLAGLRALEDFVTMARRQGRQKKGS